ncbi:MAG: hypothetical protein PHV82_12465 [Victivallaceae bacterium]|nr:hypothetical protein [Victivallaceae bacterium]
MNKTDTRNFQNGVHRLYRHISKLNFCVRNVKLLATELKSLVIMLPHTVLPVKNELSINGVNKRCE